MRQTYVPQEDAAYPGKPDIQQIPAISVAPALVNFSLECHYPETSVMAALPTEITLRQLAMSLDLLLRTEPEMTHFTIRASIRK